jgi:hypothetical protein
MPLPMSRPYVPCSDLERRRRACSTRYYKLESAVQHRSQTRPFAFVIAHECKEPYTDAESGETRYRLRDYYAFDDVETYIKNILAFPHSHEVIYGRCGMKQEGRLIFDFDLTERLFVLPDGSLDFVSPTFREDVQRCILDTFETYYVGVDPSRLRFVWLRTPHPDKHSRHLIVDGALLTTDWVVQSQTFYALFRLVAYRSGLFSYLPFDPKIAWLLDSQVARANATFRMAHCSKLGKAVMEYEPHSVSTSSKASKIASTTIPVQPRYVYSFYDTLVQVYRREEAKREQRILDGALAIDKVLQLVTTLPESSTEERLIIKNIPQLRRSLEEMERKENEASLALTESCIDCLELLGGCYEVRASSEGRITLDRHSPGDCPLSGREHDREGGFIRVWPNGDATFHCFRRCKTSGGSESLLLRRGVELGDGLGGGYPTLSSALPHTTAEESLAFLLACRGGAKELPLITPVEAADEEDAQDEEDESEEDDDEEEEPIPTAPTCPPSPSSPELPLGKRASPPSPASPPTKSRQKILGEARHQACLTTMMVSQRLAAPEGLELLLMC